MLKFHKENPGLSKKQLFSVNDVIEFPSIPTAYTSLTAAEKLLLGHFIQLISPNLIVELGCWQGLTIEFICNFLKNNNIKSQVFGFDIPEVILHLRSENPCIQNLENTQFLRLIPGRLPQSFANWLNSHNMMINLALIDANHSFVDVYNELKLIWSRLSPDGLILCHDYHWEKNPNIPGDMSGVAYAVDYFAVRTFGVHVLSLKSSEKSGETLSWEKNSSLVAIRRRPYRPNLKKFIKHLIEYSLWKFRGNSVKNL